MSQASQQSEDFDVDQRLCDICLVERSRVSRSPNKRVCQRCYDFLVEAAPIAKGYGEFMRRRYERGELRYGPGRTGH